MNFAGFFAAKFISWLVFWFMLKVVFVVFITVLHCVSSILDFIIHPNANLHFQFSGVILEGDPENSVASVEEEANGSDELLVIGEKGQVCVSLLYSFVCDCAHENYFKNLSCYWKQSLFCFGLCWRHAHCLCCLVMSIL